MLKDLVTRLLTSALSDVVKEGSINTESLKVGIWSGNFELTNLELKQDVLDALGLPVSLKYAR
jgi:hypothetical protein